MKNVAGRLCSVCCRAFSLCTTLQKAREMITFQWWNSPSGWGRWWGGGLAEYQTKYPHTMEIDYKNITSSLCHISVETCWRSFSIVWGVCGAWHSRKSEPHLTATKPGDGAATRGATLSQSPTVSVVSLSFPSTARSTDLFSPEATGSAAEAKYMGTILAYNVSTFRTTGK